MMLTKHQKRILAALLALEQHHVHSWWDRLAGRRPEGLPARGEMDV